jgi:tetratricopeptide (TPR) repeat protein
MDPIKNYKQLVQNANAFIADSITARNARKIEELRLSAASELEKVVNAVAVTDYLLIDSKGKIPKQVYLDCLFQLGSIYKSIVESQVEEKQRELQKNELRRNESSTGLTVAQESMLIKSLDTFRTILAVVFEDEQATKQIVSVYTRLSFFHQHNHNRVLQFLHEALLYSPGNEVIHYNLGFIYQKLNKLELSIIHYKTSLELMKREKSKNLEIQRMILNNYNGISGVYRSIKKWPEALYYLLKAVKAIPTDPDILNQLGVVYTEMRRTDLAEEAYNKAIKNYKSAFISTDKDFLLAEIYLI